MIEWHKEAVKDFDSVLKRNPKNAHAHFRRAFSLKALKEFKKAVADFEQA
jgi:Tfp pilus assembly protein PilF